jgi:hypothetical protein
LQSITSIGGGGGADISGKRDISDSYSRSETATLIAASGYSESEANALFQTVSASTDALDLKRDVSDSLSATEVGVLLDDKVDATTYQNTLAGLATTTDLNAAITTLDDEIVTRLTTKLDKGAAYSTSEVDTLLADAASSTNAALSTKRDEAQSYSRTQVDTLLSAQPISTVTGLQASLDAKASLTQLNQEISTLSDSVTTRMTGKRDKATSYSSTQVDQLFSDAADTSAAALSTKRDESQSYTITQTDALVSSVRAESYTATQVDALLDDKNDTITNNGSIDISAIGGLNAALGTFQSLVTSGDLSIAMTSGLQVALNTLSTDVAAIPTSQIRINDTWVNQNRFAVSNAVPQLDLGLGIWNWLVQPRFSDIQRDAARLRLARTGVPLTPSADCLCYLPMVSNVYDTGPANLHLVRVDTSATQGTYGVYQHIPPISMTQGYPLTHHVYLFPNRSVPSVQVSSSGIGWPADSASSFLIEWQVFVPADCSTGVNLSSDADANETPPEDIIFINLDSVTAELQVRWDDKIGGGNFNRIIVPNMVFANQVYSVAVQKSPGADVVRVYLNGELKVTETVGAPLTTIDLVRFQAFRTGTPIIREISVRTNAMLPEIPYGPGGVSYETGDPHLRFNSYML